MMIIPEGGSSKQPSSSFSHISSLLLGSQKFLSSESPPEYTERKPPPVDRTRITYTFTPQTIPANSMIMSPPNYLLESHPSYYITVNMDCFTPSSYITTVMRNSWQGDIVGDFEMGLSSKKPSTVFIHGFEYPLNDIMEQHPNMFRMRFGSYLWKGRTDINDRPGANLYWEESSSAGSAVLSCFLGKEKGVTNLAAMFMPANPIHLPRRPGRSASLSRLEVTPSGQEVLDEVVISILIIERIRTAPSILDCRKNH